MITKRFLLMLLLVLMSVTGAWAQEDSGTDGDIKWEYDYLTETLIFSSVDPDSDPVAMPDYENNHKGPWANMTEYAVSVKFINISHIGGFALYDAQQLISVDIPNTVTSIGEEAFSHCGSLESVTLPNSITCIGTDAFYGCTNLISINIPDRLTGLNSTFYTCPSLESITIPASVTNLGMFTFYGCTGLTSITVEAETPPSVGFWCFNGVDKAIPVLVPEGKVAAYQAAEGWSEFTCIIDKFTENVLTDYVNHVYGNNWNTALTNYINEHSAAIANEEDNKQALQMFEDAKKEIDANIAAHEHNYVWTEINSAHHAGHCYAHGFCAQYTYDENHRYGSSITNDALNYTCECGYVNETLKAPFDARDYMSMTAVGGDVVVGAKKYDKDYIPSYVIQYSQDRVNWTNYAVANDGEIMTIHNGETYYFRSGMPDVLTSVMDEFWNFTMTGSGTIEAGGNVMSLLDRSCQSLTVGDNAFRNLFDGCTPLTVAPKVPATTLGEWCYTEMFNGCTQLQKAPHLPAATLKFYCYGGMFDGCSSLDYVEADFIEAQRGKDDRDNQPFSCATADWLNGTAANGLLVMKREMIEHGYDNGDKLSIPSGWQRALKVKANEDPDHKGNFYTTFYDGNYSFDVIGEAKAYSGSIDGDELRLTPTPDNRIPRYDGVLLHGPSADIVLAINGGAYRIEGNVLTGSDNNILAPAGCYILSYGQNGLGFYRYAEGKTLSAHKAYLTYQQQARSFRMVFDDGEANGISPLPTSPEGEEIIYNLQGIRLNKLLKGINIVNGKKIIVK